jgi:hypothetical protein
MHLENELLTGKVRQMTAGHFRAVQSEQQLEAGGTCSSTSYGGLQLGTCMCWLVFYVIGYFPSHATIVGQVIQIISSFSDLLNPTVTEQKTVFDGQEHRVVTIFSAPNYCYRCGKSCDPFPLPLSVLSPAMYWLFVIW